MAQGRKTGGRKAGTPNRATAEIKALIQAHGAELIAGLLKLCKSKDEEVRLNAIKAALDRGYGRPAQAVTGEDGGPIKMIIVDTGIRRGEA